jgi:hypothetical protein
MDFSGFVQWLKDLTGPLRLRRRRIDRRLRFVDWLASPAGPRSEMLRQINPGFFSWFVIWSRQLRNFERPGRRRPLYVPPPPSAKHAAIRRYGRDHHLRTFVETGTYLGDTTAAVADDFAECITIELSPALHAQAASRFSEKSHVTCLLGDSASVLRAAIRQIKTPALFWLDAHNSGGTTADSGQDPIVEELKAIYQNDDVNHVVLIDDARGHDIDGLARWIPGDASVSVRNDIVRIIPGGSTCPSE